MTGSSRLFTEDLREVSQVRELGLKEIPGRLQAERSGSRLVVRRKQKKKNPQMNRNTLTRRAWFKTIP